MFEQDTLFGKKVIKTISFNEQEIIRDILYLHCKNQDIELDPTYSIGNFYTKGLRQPKYKFDIEPKIEDVRKSDCTNLPLKDSSIDTIMFDPPFVMGGQTYKKSKSGSCITAKRFSSFKNWPELKTMYIKSLKEFHRILKTDGIIIFKCQDVIVGGKQYFTHVKIYEWAVSIGYYPQDLFVLLAKARILDGRKQQHARKYHCYFWVLRKSASTGKEI